MGKYYLRGSEGKPPEFDSIVDARAEAYRELMTVPVKTVFIMETYDRRQIGFVQRYKGKIMMYIRPKYHGGSPARRYVNRDGTLGKEV